MSADITATETFLSLSSSLDEFERANNNLRLVIALLSRGVPSFGSGPMLWDSKLKRLLWDDGQNVLHSSAARRLMCSSMLGRLLVDARASWDALVDLDPKHKGRTLPPRPRTDEELE